MQNKLIAAGCSVMFAACTVSASGPDSSVFVPAGTFHAEVEGPDTDSAGNLYAVNFGGAGDEHKGSYWQSCAGWEGQLALALTGR